MTAQKQVLWDELSALDQWLCLRARDAQHGKKPDSVGSAEVFCGLVNGHRQRVAIEWTDLQAPPGLSHNAFFRKRYREILKAVPLERWQDVVACLDRGDIPFSDLELQNATELSSHWRRLRSGRRTVRLAAVDSLVDFLIRALSLELVRRESLGNQPVYGVRISLPNLRLPEIIPLVVSFVRMQEGGAETALRYLGDLQRTLEVRGKAARGLILNLVVGSGEEYQRYLAHAARQQDLLVIDEGKLAGIFLGERYSEELHTVIKSDLSLVRLSPYTPEKPVHRPEMFFGRAEETRRVLDSPDRNFLVVGARRIGKSSFLRFLQDTTRAAGSHVAILIDCSDIGDGDTLARGLANQVNPRRARRIQIGHIPQLFKVSQSVRNKPYLVLLDEVDRLVELAYGEDNWRTFNVLRELSNSGAAQVVITGFSTLYRTWQDLSSPIFNFGTPIYLSVLSHRSAWKLVAEPLRALDVEFKSEDLVEQIVRETGGHPSFLQFFCAELIHVLDLHGSRLVTADVLHAVRQSREYRELVMKPLLYAPNMSALQRWIVLEVVRGHQYSFTVDELLEAMKPQMPEVPPLAVAEGLNELELAGVIRSKSPSTKSVRDPKEIRYVWTIPGFPVAVERSFPIDKAIEELKGVVASETGRRR